jgi:hypothetical protein
MSGALPNPSTTHSSIPRSLPLGNLSDETMSRHTSHRVDGSLKPSSPTLARTNTIIVPDDSLEGSTMQSMSSHRPPSSKSDPKISSKRSSAHRSASTRTTAPSHSVTTRQHVENLQENSEKQPSASISLSTQGAPKQSPYYCWRAPKYSLDSSRNSATIRQTLSHSSHAEKPSPRQSTTEINSWIQEEVAEDMYHESHRSRSTDQVPLPSSHSSSSNARDNHSSSTHSQRSARSEHQSFDRDDKGSGEVVSDSVSEWMTSLYPASPSAHGSNGEAAEWEGFSSSADSQGSRASTRRQSRSRTSKVSHSGPRSDFVQDNDEWESFVGTETRTKMERYSKASENTGDDLVEYSPPPSDDERLPPPMPNLTTIYEDAESEYLEHALYSSSYHETKEHNITQYARPGVITPHPLSSISSISTARRPPSVELGRLEYRAPFIESETTSSTSFKSQSHGCRSSRQRMLQERSYHTVDDSRRSSREGGSEGSRTVRSQRSSERTSARKWKWW